VRYLYTFLLTLAMPFIFMKLLWRSRRLPAYRQRMFERLGFYPVKLDKCLWVHAVSVGEVIAALPLIKSLQASHPDLPMLVTTMTPTGYVRVKAALGDTVQHVYLPYDLPCAVKRFLSSMNPIVCVIIETELWPNMLATCRQHQIPVCLTNARLSEKSAQGYARIALLTREMLRNVTRISACGQADADRFIALGAQPEQLTVTGNLKFDLVLPDGLLAKAKALRESLGNERFIWIAASTHEGEEEIILNAHRKLLAINPQALLILVPRHPDRFNLIAEMTAKQFTAQRRSLGEAINADTTVYIGDTMGEMLLMYAVSDVAFVAGSLIPRGGHNILEPAVLAKPILTGVHVFNFGEICQMFMQSEAMLQVTDGGDLAAQIIHLQQHPELCQSYGQRALAVMDANRGALAKQIQIIEKVIATAK
jgi:3-deoxy-D-manno-octulosonic-acid transferase